MALVFAPHLGEMDVMKLLKICVVHDLGEALGGDVPANVQSSKTEKADRERADLQELVTPLAPPQRDEILRLWDEYEAASSPEARIAKGLDKLETILHPTLIMGSTWNTGASRPPPIRYLKAFAEFLTRTRDRAGPSSSK
jgi:putative hydrolase of HD superfamily